MNGWWFDELGVPIHLVCGGERTRWSADGWTCQDCDGEDA